MTGRTLLLVSLFSLGVAGVSAAEPTRLVTRIEPGLPPSASRLAEARHPWVAGVMDLVGLSEAGAPIRVLLAPESSPLARSVPSWVSGYTDGVSNTVVLLPERTPSYPDGGLEDVLAHEVAHVLIYRASAGRRIPRWFNEGVAMLASRSWRLRDETQLALTLLSGDKVPLYGLDDLFEKDRWQVERAYALSGALVQDLLDRYGSGLPAALLSRVAQGLSFDEALRRTTGATLSDVGDAFWARQGVLKRWIPILTSTAVLWLGITILAIVAALKRRRDREAELERQAAEEMSSDDDLPVH
ncbi:MAG: peptidase MA family metallohydrolase [Thermoanaerobaculia bacterium]